MRGLFLSSIPLRVIVQKVKNCVAQSLGPIPKNNAIFAKSDDIHDDFFEDFHDHMNIYFHDLFQDFSEDFNDE